MPRKSEEKSIINKALYSKLAPQYIRLIERLQNKYETIENDYFSDLVNFKQNKENAKHGWFIYKQGFAEDLVKALISREKPSKKYYVLDPFAGVGTTNLVAQSMGYKSIGFDINPIATFAAKVKTSFFTEKESSRISHLIDSFSPVRSKVIPDSPLLEKAFSEDSFEKLMSIKGFFENINDEKMQEFFKLAYLSIVERCSNRVKDGNGIKIMNNKPKIDNLHSLFLDKSRSMLRDIQSLNFDSEAVIINGSLTKNFDAIKNKKIGIVIFSPPYANCFDYCEVYKLELWMGEFVRDYSDFGKYRTIAVRSHVNSTFDHAIANRNKDVDLIADLISCFNVWNKNIPDMVRGYFDDMTQIFEKMKNVMVKGAKCFIVVANSGYKGILVPTDLLFADIAKEVGFKPLQIIHARKMRASSQQMDELNGKYGTLMRESIVALEKI